MIDQTVFSEWWAVLCERFGKDGSSTLAGQYYRSLSPRMETEGFEQACRTLFNSERFFPPPDSFIEAVEGTSEEQALDQWELCWAAMEGRAGIQRMSEAGKRTVSLMGGIQHLRNTPLDSVPFVRKEFLRLYGHAHDIYQREHQSLPKWTDEGRALYEQVEGTKQIGSGGKSQDDAA